MKKNYTVFALLFWSYASIAQPVQDRLSAAAQRLLADSQLKHAILGLSIVKSETGEKVFELNPQAGLAPASCQKTITSAAAMELLGPAYRYETILAHNGTINNGTLSGNIYLVGSGDPSMGSWRFDSSNSDRVLKAWINVLKQNGIRKINGSLVGFTGKWEAATIPGGWIWDDIGNYYGAGASALNWHENQYDLVLRSGDAAGDSVTIVATRPKLYNVQFESRLLAAAKGTGDNAYIYLAPSADKGFVSGTIPVSENGFSISGSFPDPPGQLLATLYASMDSAGLKPVGYHVLSGKMVSGTHTLQVYRSPPLDSLNYWFMKKSINLYGESFLKTIAYEQSGTGSTGKGLEVLKKFWQARGIEPSALHILDGSGLSPQNRVTADALVKVLQYARERSWFRYYYDALPVYNQMKLKSGTIGGAKSFAGYHTAKDGTAYTVAMIINNYEGSAAEMVKKMFRLLDELK